MVQEKQLHAVFAILEQSNFKRGRIFMIEINPAKIEEIPELCKKADVKLLDGINVFCLKSRNELISFCIFNEFECNIIKAVFYDDDKSLKNALIKAVLNHFDLKGVTEVWYKKGELDDILKGIGFCEKDDQLLLNLKGYFTSPHC